MLSGHIVGKRHDMMDLVAFGPWKLDGEEGVAGADVAHDVFRGDVGPAVDLPVLDQAVEFLTKRPVRTPFSTDRSEGAKPNAAHSRRG